MYLKEYIARHHFSQSVTTRDETAQPNCCRKFVSKFIEASKRRKVVKPIPLILVVKLLFALVDGFGVEAGFDVFVFVLKSSEGS